VIKTDEVSPSGVYYKTQIGGKCIIVQVVIWFRKKAHAGELCIECWSRYKSTQAAIINTTDWVADKMGNLFSHVLWRLGSPRSGC
jgi:L-ribulose-5-phosphate 3-epimerase UlaE